MSLTFKEAEMGFYWQLKIPGKSKLLEKTTRKKLIKHKFKQFATLSSIVKMGFAP